MLGPVDALKWELPPETFPHELAVEQWSLPGGPHFVELSFKVKPDEAENAERAFQALLERWISVATAIPSRRPRVLRFLAEAVYARICRRSDLDEVALGDVGVDQV